MTDVQAKLIESLYLKHKSEKTITINNFLHSLSQKDIELLDGFHTSEVVVVDKNDDYFCGARANTFVVMLGWDEHLDYNDVILIQSNHKGNMHFTMFEY
ncbi:hypothetical protein QI260_05985 [Staphylococcus saprophyticus]|nr:hypothetical protein [Staphylococcus saprophyticus]